MNENANGIDRATPSGEREEIARAVLAIIFDSLWAGEIADAILALGYRKPAPAAPDAPTPREATDDDLVADIALNIERHAKYADPKELARSFIAKVRAQPPPRH